MIGVWLVNEYPAFSGIEMSFALQVASTTESQYLVLYED